MRYVIREIVEQELEECASVIRSGFLTVAEKFAVTKENAPTNGAFLQKERLSEERAKGHMMYVAIRSGVGSRSIFLS
jgi:diamine N-acetyltransferase